MTNAFKTRQGKVEDFALDFANRLLQITDGCRPDMHEPDEQGDFRADLFGSHLDNAMGDTPGGKFGEYVLTLQRKIDTGRNVYHFNLATLIAFARIGAEAVRLEAAEAMARKEST